MHGITLFLLFAVAAAGVPQQEVDELRACLQQAEDQNSDLKERLKTTTTSVEQYRSMVLSLEESLNKEKQVMMPWISGHQTVLVC